MTKRRSLSGFGILVLLAAATPLAQSQPQAVPAPGASATPAVTPLELQVVIAKFKGEKKIASLPYTLTVAANSNARSSLRMGANVPVVTGVSAPETPSPVMSVNYQNVGTSIDCNAQSLGEGLFRIDITIEESSVYENPPGASTKAAGHPWFRSFKASETLVLRDGQSTEFTTATDKVSGEVVKADVTLRVLK